MRNTHPQTSPLKAPLTVEAPYGATQRLWRLLDALALCRDRYGLATNSLSVLRALISFLPKSATDHDAMVVWPSNQTLAERADGMDERTLRRHLAKLCEAGLIARQSSANGKRFALRIRQSIVAAYGLDLQPLRDRAAEILEAADEARLLEDQISATRKQILNLLFTLRDIAGRPTNQEAEIRRQLRRNVSLAELLETQHELEGMQAVAATVTTQLTASDSQNDRHLQRAEEEYFDSVNAAPDSETAIENQSSDLTLSDCLEAATESLALAPEPVKTWSDLVRLADLLAPMIGIGRELADHSRRAMGPLPAAISILCLIQRGDQIHKPAAYLRKLALLAEQGLYSLKSLVRKAQRHRFAAVN